MTNGDYIIRIRRNGGMQRSLQLFKNSIKSKATLRQYEYYLKKFMGFFDVKDFDDLIAIPAADLQIMVEDYVMDLKTKVSPNTVPTPMQAIQTFFDCNGIELKWKKIRKLYPAKIKVSGERGWTTEEIQKMLLTVSNLRNRAIIHFFASTGARAGVLNGLQLKHLKEMPDGCKSVLVYADDIEEYTTFLTPEASKVLDEYFNERRSDGEQLTPESPVFRSSYSVALQPIKPLSTKSAENVIRRAAISAGLRNKKKNGRYEVQLEHGFRKRFNTVLKLNKSINSNIVEKLMGHKRGLDGVYLKPTIDELFEEFKIGIIDLTISDTARLERRNKQLEDEKSDLEKSQARIDELERRLRRFEKTKEM